MTDPNPNHPLREAFNAFQADEDLRTIPVLKSHLLMEELLRSALLPKFPQPKYMDSMRLTYMHLLSLARASTPHENDNRPWIWGMAKQLNEIRNTFAHRLNPAEIDTKAGNYVGMLPDDEVLGKWPGVLKSYRNRPFALVAETRSPTTAFEMASFSLFVCTATALNIDLHETIGEPQPRKPKKG